MTITEAVRTLRDYCNKFDEKCTGCVFHSESMHECVLSVIPLEWKDPPCDTISEDIQHVGYDADQCGRNK